MNQPLHNPAIPAHPGIASQSSGVPAPESTNVSTPTSAPSSENQVQSLWEAFDVSPEAASSVPPPAPPPVVQAPAQPSMPPEVPPGIDDLLTGGSSPEPQVQTPEPMRAPEVPTTPPQSAAPPVDVGVLQKQAIDFLMANEYRLSDEDRTQLISAPDEVLPRLAARMHVGIATQLAQQVAQAIPSMIQQHLDTHVKAQRAEMEFFARYPKLNRPEWKETIAESLKMVKQMNPQADRERVIREGAALAAFRINSTFGNRYSPPPPQQMRAPVQPYTPVAPGGGMTSPTNSGQQSNPWADLAADPDWNPW